MRAAAEALRRLPELRVPPGVLPAVGKAMTIACLAGALLLGLYMAWLRNSGLVAVEHVTVTGLTSSDAPRIREALIATARDMTTLHVRQDQLRGSVAGFPVVRSLDVQSDFPHALRVRVIEQRPVAVVGSTRMPLAGDGSVLRGMGAGRVPTLDVSGRLSAGRAQSPDLLALAGLAGAAPPALLGRVQSLTLGSHGLTARLRNGPEIWFGSARRLGAKWAAATAVLADRASRGAAYVDVRMPERPVAGGLPVQPVQPADTSTPSPAEAATGAPASPVTPSTPAAPTNPQAGVQP